MKLESEALKQLQFRSKGKWYDGRQVDAFLDELMTAVTQNEEERNETLDKLAQLQTENDDLRRRVEELTAAQLPETPEQERQRLLDDIKALRAFRERFRAAVEEDVSQFAAQARRFSSDELLP